MELLTPFATPVGRFKASEFISLSEKWFENSKSLAQDENNLSTTLRNYNGLYKQEVLQQQSLFEDKIIECVKVFCKAIGYNTVDYQVIIDRIWLNEMDNTAYHKLHSHYGSIFSGCFYPKIPTGSAGITFIGSRGTLFWQAPFIEEYTPYTSTAWNFNVDEGDLLIWESHLQHTVPKSNFEGIRRSVAFDIKMKEV